VSRDYRDYFIKDGRHIGDYEAMYQNCPDPWGIEAMGLRLDMRAALLLLDMWGGPSDKVLDLGCGAGLFSLQIIKKLFAKNPSTWYVLSDISPTALKLAKKKLFADSMPLFNEAEDSRNPMEYLRRRVEKAKKKGAWEPAVLLTGPVVDFLPLDLRAISEDNPFLSIGFNLIVLSQVLWGILEALESVLGELRRTMAPDGALLISQHFPGEAQEYGRDTVKSPEDLRGYLQRAGFAEIHSLETDRAANHHYGGLWRAG
jgi:SAM-dependent methyltransferase